MAYNPNLANASSFFNSSNIQSQPIKERVSITPTEIYEKLVLKSPCTTIWGAESKFAFKHNHVF